MSSPTDARYEVTVLGAGIAGSTLATIPHATTTMHIHAERHDMQPENATAVRPWVSTGPLQYSGSNTRLPDPSPTSDERPPRFRSRPDRSPVGRQLPRTRL
jgi:hypothetical protein